MSIAGYTEIENDKALQVFLHETVTFHDSIVKELQLINRSSVTESKSMTMNHRFDARVLFQVQREPIAIEMIFLDIVSLTANGPGEYMGSEGKVINADGPVFEISLDGAFIVQCRKMFYNMSPLSCGSSEHLGSQVPEEGMRSAESLKENWRLCQNCFEAWEVATHLEIATCPNCQSVTSLLSQVNTGVEGQKQEKSKENK